jgi:hypothetical protein
LFQHRLQIQKTGVATAVAHGHGFDQAQDKAVFDTETHHGFDIGFIDIFHCHHIDLDRRRPASLAACRPAITCGRLSRPVMLLTHSRRSESRLTLTRLTQPRAVRVHGAPAGWHWY